LRLRPRATAKGKQETCHRDLPSAEKQKNHPPFGEWPLTIACLIENSYFLEESGFIVESGVAILESGVDILVESGAGVVSIFVESAESFLSPSLPHDAKPRLATAKTMKSFFILL
jgi:hypothetical protein